MANTTTTSFHFPHTFLLSPTTTTSRRRRTLQFPPPPPPLSNQLPRLRSVGSRQKPHNPRTTNNTSTLNSPTIKAEAPLNTDPMLPPFNVLITGSTKGIGYALAREFLKAGDNVVICSRSAERVQSAVQSLREEFGEQHVVLRVMLERRKL